MQWRVLLLFHQTFHVIKHATQIQDPVSGFALEGGVGTLGQDIFNHWASWTAHSPSLGLGPPVCTVGTHWTPCSLGSLPPYTPVPHSYPKCQCVSPDGGPPGRVHAASVCPWGPRPASHMQWVQEGREQPGESVNYKVKQTRERKQPSGRKVSRRKGEGGGCRAGTDPIQWE